jgi:hypothetical protein
VSPLLPVEANSPGDMAALGKRYRLGRPWPHIVLDGCISETLVAQAEREELVRAQALRPHCSHRELKAESSTVGGSAAREILSNLQSADFVKFIEQLSGIENLINDPTHHWGGLHAMPRGGFSAIHRDFSQHPMTRLHHRVNVLIYLNTHWESSYGGELELWPADMSVCVQRITPVAGRMVIFETTSDTLHGVPDPVACPEDRMRLSLASYYYSKEQPVTRQRRPPLLIRPRRPQDPHLLGLVGVSEIYAGMIWRVKRWLGRGVSRY